MPTFNPTSFAIIVKGVSAPGTAEQIVQHYIPDGMMVTVTARRANTGTMYLAFSQSDAQGTNRKNLVPGQSFDLYVPDTSFCWVDADSTSDRLEFTIQKRA